MPRLALEANIEMWFGQERWLVVRPRILNDNFFERIFKKVDGGWGEVARWSFRRKMVRFVRIKSHSNCLIIL